MSLVRVYTDIGGLKPVHLIAKIFEIRESTYMIRYLSPTDDKKYGKVIYRYEDETYEIGDESISKYMDTSDETELGFRAVGDDGFIMIDNDSEESDYDPDEDDGTDGSGDQSDTDCSDVPTEELSDDDCWSEN